MPNLNKQFGEIDQVEGRNPVIEALRGRRKVLEIYIASGLERSEQIDEIIRLAGLANVAVKEAPRTRIDSMARTSAPQGVIAFVSLFEFDGITDLLFRLENVDLPLVLALDNIQDPQNFGALLRVADAAGADAVVIPGRRSASVTATVASASAGAVEHVRVARVASLPAALERFKSAGLWVVGAHSGSGVPYYEFDMKTPLVLVLGSEGKGLGRLVRERCDELVSLPMRGRVSSLNVATAGAVLLYEAIRQRTK
ncbi:MAG: 23S rRNA (guanosine(2251)-2'-O)-methyltransferase RlmB [Candidatus Anoxymicrobium japonicum]|uniref:23S rRNA (Guanosine(2251)-2'-O)-methyltransferase RlmB n=1 Tax=Candidatus Anoxymicrobium japonicum TaxID=2013648 RepID=A0A2N3G6T9_9ACTN|nr:MAG: 23S rRNA (guanosine(2251)-2'-O)-methyltransferase RlmB [Candidatus Anoxymicrobium japonicum]